ncbi:hypothetical protein SCALM49S_06110 [Streptomyces californicus]
MLGDQRGERLVPRPAVAWSLTLHTNVGIPARSARSTPPVPSRCGAPTATISAPYAGSSPMAVEERLEIRTGAGDQHDQPGGGATGDGEGGEATSGPFLR